MSVRVRVRVQLLFRVQRDVGRDVVEDGAAERVLALVLQVLAEQGGDVQVAVGRLREVLLVRVHRGHRVEPDAAQLGAVAVRLGQTVLRVDQHLRVVLQVQVLQSGQFCGTQNYCQFILTIRNKQNITFNIWLKSFNLMVT